MMTNRIQWFSVALGLASVGCFIRCDVSDISSEAKISHLLLGLWALVWSCAMTVLAGSWRFPGTFSLFQPFCGGNAFVLLQVIGWTLCGSAVVLCLVACVNVALITSPIESDLENWLPLSNLGFVGFFANLVLNFSIPRFSPDDSKVVLEHRGNGRLVQTLRVSSLLALGSICALCGADATKLRAFHTVMGAVGLLAMVAGAVVTHVSAAVHLAGYRLYAPFQGGFVCVVLQALGWTLFGIALDIGLSLLFSPLAPLRITLALSATGLIGCFAQGLLIASVLSFDASSSVPATSFHVMGRSLPIGVIVSCALAALAWIPLVIGPGHKGSSIAMVTSLTSFLSHLSAPLAHLSGPRVYPAYQLWQPLVGGFAFICMQAFGWTLYGFSVALHVTALVQPTVCSLDIVLLAPLAFFAQATVLGSLPYYTPPTTPLTSVGPAPFPSWVAIVLQGICRFDAFVSHTLALSAVLAAFVHKMFPEGAQLWLMGSYALGVTSIGVTCNIVAKGRFPSFSWWQPFKGGNVFVAIQAVSWTIFGICQLFYILTMLTHATHQQAMLPWRVTLLLASIIFCVHLALLGSLSFFESDDRLSSAKVPSLLPVPNAAATTVAIARIGHSGLEELIRVMESIQDPNLKAVLADVKNQAQTCLETSKIKPTEQPVTRAGNVQTRTKSQTPHNIKNVLDLIMGVTTALTFVAAHVLITSRKRSNQLANSEPFPPTELVFSGAVLCGVCSVAISHGLNSFTVQGYRFYQPGDGGFRFVLFHAIAWSLFGSGMFLSFAFAALQFTTPVPAELEHSPRGLHGMLILEGAVLGIGTMFATAHLLVCIATPWFVPPATKSSKHDALVILSLCACGALVLVDNAILLEAGPYFPRTAVVAAAFLAMLASVPLTYYSHGNLVANREKSKKGWIGVVWGDDALLQVIGVTLWAFTVLLTLLALLRTCCSKVSRVEMTSTGFTGVLSQLLILFAFRVQDKKSLTPTKTWLSDRLWSMAGALAHHFSFHFTLPMVRKIIDLHIAYQDSYLPMNCCVTQDGHQALKDVVITRDVRYGKHELERVHIIKRRDAKDKSECGGSQAKCCMVYIHGGGWVSTNSWILVHSVTPFARLGMDVYCMDYPLAPQDRFPTAIVSVLRCLAFIRATSPHKRICLFGDSAGGNLATIVAALMSDPELMARSQQSLPDDVLSSLRLPTVDRVVSLYGVLDTESWRGTVTGIVLDFCLRCYSPKEPSAFLDGALTIGQLSRSTLSKMPPTLLLCGKDDDLCASSEQVHKQLVAAGVSSKLVTYPGFHGFLGFPVPWIEGYFPSRFHWTQNTLPATEEIAKFLLGKDAIVPPREEVMERARIAPKDWSIIFVYGSFLVPFIAPLLVKPANVLAYRLAGWGSVEAGVGTQVVGGCVVGVLWAMIVLTYFTANRCTRLAHCLQNSNSVFKAM
eukprot:c16519_g2_i2.p1 GENE.c16519_g2_i2~~c16519_g2_i2.p1  ORF type:complete len:1428 (+),score=267.78 c16519_g2_i2:25-4308(+)